jgi:16S rRNA processing protein RimM
MSSWRSALTTNSERLAIGRVVGAKGLRGQVKVESLSDRPERFAEGAAVYVDGDSHPRRITAVEASPRVIVLTLDGVADRDAAEALIGRYLEVDRAPLPPDTYYWHELIGVTARDEAGRLVGEVADVFRAGENEVYRIVGPDGERLVPALRAFVTALDVPARMMTVRLDEEEVR